MATPFTADGALDVAAAQALAVRLVDEGNDGLVVAGTTGESPTLAEHEHDTLLAAVVEAVGDRAHLVAGCGNNDTDHTLRRARAAEKTGVHGLLVVTPYYNKPPQEGLYRHFTAAADATDLPVMLYDIPGRTGTAVASETLVRLAEHPRIVAVKDAKDDLFASAAVMAATAGGLAYYSGSDQINLAHLAQGAAGIVSVVAHVAAPQYARMVAAVDSGDLATARSLNAQLVPAVTAIMTRAQGAVMVKAALELTGAIPNRHVRLPLVEATDEQVAHLADDLRGASLL
ncbi:4-hydroxy-tetrahydrodipicolinate synthase [Quadrisphaera sp. INWT6]|nr:4-hydroxy-tetrahydrodipicolinate synthase [Quadrisphaera sp. INWT6]